MDSSSTIFTRRIDSPVESIAVVDHEIIGLAYESEIIINQYQIDSLNNTIESNDMSFFNTNKDKETKQSLDSVNNTNIIINTETSFDYTNKPIMTNQKQLTLPVKEYRQLKSILLSLSKHDSSWPFTRPVDIILAPDYYQVIKHPQDLQKITKRLTDNKFDSSLEFIEDVMLMFSNCFTYNPPSNGVYSAASSLQIYFSILVNKEFPHLMLTKQDSNVLLE